MIERELDKEEILGGQAGLTSPRMVLTGGLGLTVVALSTLVGPRVYR